MTTTALRITRGAGKLVGRPDAAFQAKLRAWLAGNPKAKATWKHRRPDLPDQSMGGYDAELQRLALADGWTDAWRPSCRGTAHQRGAGGAGHGCRFGQACCTGHPARHTGAVCATGAHAIWRLQDAMTL
jgi:hypothetical protein